MLNGGQPAKNEDAEVGSTVQPSSVTPVASMQNLHSAKASLRERFDQ